MQLYETLLALIKQRIEANGSAVSLPEQGEELSRIVALLYGIYATCNSSLLIFSMCKGLGEYLHYP